MRRLLGWAGLLALLGVLAGGFLVARLRTGPGLPTGERVVAGLDGPVEILWDSVGIPHVWASTQRDALFAQGYLHGTHRLWQVEMFRRVATGRLSELFGDATLETDRFLRTLGMDRAAEAGASLLSLQTLELLQGYVDGLNAAVDGWEGFLPPEFLIPEFQALLRPIALLLKLVNMFWGFGAAILLPALVFWLGGSERSRR